MSSNNLPLHPISSVFLDADLLSDNNKSNNTFVFSFSNDVCTSSDSRISVSNFSVPFSWFNITAAYQNNEFKYVWFDKQTVSADFPAPTGGTIFTVTIPDGYYDLPTLNSFLQYTMIQNGHVLIDSNGNNVYYLDFQYNLSIYRIELNSYQLPNDLPIGWTKPAGCTIKFHADGGANNDNFYTPKILLYLPSSKANPTANLGKDLSSLFTYFGWNPTPSTLLNGIGINCRILPVGNPNPAVTKFQSVVTDTAPRPLVVHSICLTCNMVDNSIRSTAAHHVPTYVITSQDATNTPFGHNIQNNSLFTTWMSLVKDTPVPNRQLVFTLVDQEGRDVVLVDPDVNIELLLTNMRYTS